MTSLRTRIQNIRSTDPGRLTRELHRFARFGIVGATGFLVDFGILNLLLFVAGFAPWLANTCSFSIAVSHTFTWNRIWTFPESRRRPIVHQLVQFFVVNLVGLGINQAVFLGSNAVLWQKVAIDATAWNLAKATASGVALFWNFGANRVWTWRGL